MLEIDAPDHPLLGGVVTVRHRRADHDVVLAAVAVEQDHPGGEQHHVERRALRPGELAEIVEKGAVDPLDPIRPTEALPGWPGPVGRQFDHRGRPCEGLAPVGDLLGPFPRRGHPPLAPRMVG